MVIKRLVLCCWSCAVGFSCLFSQGMVNVQILDAMSQEPIAGAPYRISWSEVFTDQVADQQGRFSIDRSSQLDFPFSLILSPPGYENQKVEISEAGSYRYLLQPTGYEVGEVVLRAYQAGKSLQNQSGSVSVLTARELNREQDISIVPALNRVPGVYMHSGALNTNRLTIRGIGARSPFSTSKLRAYFQEIPLTTGDGETTIEDLDLQLLGRVEVIKGPASSMYGAGLGGTLLFSPRPADQAKSGAGAHFSAGSYGLLRGGMRVQAVSQHSQLQISYNQTHSDGYRENNQFDRQVLGVLGQWEAGEKSMVNLVATYVKQKAFIPSSIDSTTFADEPTAAAFTWARTKGFEAYEKTLLGLGFTHAFSDQWEFRGSVFGSFRRNEEPRPFDILREYNLALGSRSSLVYTGQLAQRPISWSLGTEVFREWYNWQTYTNVSGLGELGSVRSDNEESRQYANVFTQADWELSNRSRLTLGLNANRTNYTYIDWFRADSVDLSGDYQFEPSLSPRLAFWQEIKKDLSVHASISHGFSPPSLSETLTPDGLLNPEIQPETGWNYELGGRGYFFQRKLWVDLSLYRMEVRNLLVPKRVGNDQYVGRNAGRTRHDGFEISLDYALLERDAVQLHAYANYALARYRFLEFSDEEAAADYAGNELTGTPPHSLSAGLDLTTRLGLFANLSYQFVDAMPLRDDNSIYSTAYQLLNLKTGYRKQLKQGHQIELYGGINNLGNTAYASMLLINAGSFGGNAPRYYYPGLPRNIYAGIRIGVFGG